MKRWTGFLAALLLAGSLPAQPLALASLREQEALQGAAAQEAAQPGQTAAGAQEASQDGMPEAVQVSAAVSPESALLNGAALGAPQDPASPALDALVDAVMDELITGDMSTYDKVKACYDYVTDRTSYGDHMAYMSTPIGDSTCWDVYQDYGDVEGFGAVALTAGRGMCNAYACAFILMVRRLGLDAGLVKGYTMSGGGGYARHEWAEVTIGGTPYVFDPQLDQSFRKSGLPAYSLFCKSYAALGRRYKK